MRTLITGGAGFIGSNLVRSLLQKRNPRNQEFQITVLDSLTYAGSRTNLEGADHHFVFGDVRDSDLVMDLVSQTDCVIHLAAESHVDRSIEDPGSFVDTNIRGSLNLLDACRRLNKRIVMVSTDEVYGSLNSGVADEDFPILPSSPYSASKASAELMALSYHKTYNLDVVITRCSNNYGPRQFPEKLIPLAINRIIRNESIPIYGTGRNIRDWIHVDDHCEGLYLALMKGAPGRIYNFGEVDQVDNLTIIKRLLDLLGKDEKLIKFVDDRLGHDFRYAIKADRARVELGWNSTRTLTKDLPEVVDWYVKLFENKSNSLRQT